MKFEVYTCNEIIDKSKLHSLINSKPLDHSIISLEFAYTYNIYQNRNEKEQVGNGSYHETGNILYNNQIYNLRNKPENFLKNNEWKTKKEEIVQTLENSINNQQELDSVFENFSGFDKTLKFETIGYKKTILQEP